MHYSKSSMVLLANLSFLRVVSLIRKRKVLKRRCVLYLGQLWCEIQSLKKASSFPATIVENGIFLAYLCVSQKVLISLNFTKIQFY